MTNEEINSMFQEVLDAINESSTRLEERIEEKINSLRQEMNQRFDWVEANMATKSQMYRLIDVLRGGQIISEFDSNYIMNNQPLA